MTGSGRVLEPAGAMPQAAFVLDPWSEIIGGEIAVDVDHLNLDSASYRDLREHAADVAAMRHEVAEIVRTRGKMHNPRTGSGGMLVGRVAEIGPAVTGIAVGDPVATLISLTATPLQLRDELERWDGASEVVPADARAILPSARTISVLPPDIAPEVALSVLDVCGAPALTTRVLTRPMISGSPRRLVLLGGGKSAVLGAAAARRLGVEAICVVPSGAEAARLRELEVFDGVLVGDATRPQEVHDAVAAAGGLADLTLVCVNAPGCEHAALLATREGGAIVYFSMATSFTAVALGAEAICRDLDLYIGSGYVPGHADLALDLVRADARVRRFFETIHDSHHPQEEQ